MKAKLLVTLAVVTVLCSVTCSVDARTWYINAFGTGDAPSVQAGIDSAVVGDTVLVACGTYYEHSILMKSEICLKGESTVPPCVILDGQDNELLMICSNNSASTFVEGFEFTNAGVAIGSSGSFGTVQDCTFTDNHMAIRICCGSPIVHNCLIYGNLHPPTPSIGVSFGPAQPVISHCTIVENSAGIVLSYDAGVTIENSIIAYSRDGAAIEYDWLTLPGPQLFSCSNFFGNQGSQDSVVVAKANATGCFSADPEFCGILGSGNFYLQSDSPCAPSNHPNGYECGLIGALAVNCGKVETENRSWGAIKSIYNRN